VHAHGARDVSPAAFAAAAAAALERFAVALEARPQVLGRHRLTRVPTADVDADLIQYPVDQHAGLAHRPLRTVDKGALYSLPLLAQADDVVEQANARRTALDSELIARLATRRLRPSGRQPGFVSGILGCGSRRSLGVAGSTGIGVDGL
jgi:hypothetical protein